MEEDRNKMHRALSRRSFLATMGAGATAVMASSRIAAAGFANETVRIEDPKEMTKVKLRINGRDWRLLVEPRWSLLFVLRERLGLTGTKIGCERGECGACTVLIDNVPRYACMTLALEAEHSEVVTIEGLLHGEKLGSVQQEFLEHDAFQCGYCTPGQIMAAEGLLRAKSNPTDEEIRKAVSGNLCRCGAYKNIFQAVKKAAELKRG